jgi:hypothetical protein
MRTSRNYLDPIGNHAFSTIEAIMALGAVIGVVALLGGFVQTSKRVLNQDRATTVMLAKEAFLAQALHNESTCSQLNLASGQFLAKGKIASADAAGMAIGPLTSITYGPNNFEILKLGKNTGFYVDEISLYQTTDAFVTEDPGTAGAVLAIRTRASQSGPQGKLQEFRLNLLLDRTTLAIKGCYRGFSAARYCRMLGYEFDSVNAPPGAICWPN